MNAVGWSNGHDPFGSVVLWPIETEAWLLTGVPTAKGRSCSSTIAAIVICKCAMVLRTTTSSTGCID
ncbi:MAG: hypothetical protein ACI92S_004836 [Planctomycetaceae bacterium]|jgi:hypothetical protein